MAGEYSSYAHTVNIAHGFIAGDAFYAVGSFARTECETDSDAFHLPGDFTAEFFGLRFDSVTTRQHLLSQFNSTGNQKGYLWVYRGDLSPKRLTAFWSTDGSADATSPEISWSPSAATDYDVCIERSGTTVRLYVDGSLVGSDTMSGTTFNSNAPFQIGHSEHLLGSFAFLGRYKAFRLTKGVARYDDAGGYTVPSLPLPTSGP